MSQLLETPESGPTTLNFALNYKKLYLSVNIRTYQEVDAISSGMAAAGGFLGRFRHGRMLCKCAGSALAFCSNSGVGLWGLGVVGVWVELYNLYLGALGFCSLGFKCSCAA